MFKSTVLIQKLGISITAMVLVVAHLFFPDRINHLVILLTLLAIGPWILPFISKHIKSLEGFGGRIDFLEQRVKDESQRIDNLFFLSIGDKLLTHMRKLNHPTGYGKFFVGTALPRELEQLENLGYIRFRGKLKGLDDFQKQLNFKEGDNLSDYVELTDAGKLFLRLRDQSQTKRDER